MMKKLKIIMMLALLHPLATQAAERIISAGAGITELVLELGGKEQLIAVDSTSRLPEGENLPVVGYHRQLSSEGLLSLKPTLLLGSDEMGPATTLEQLQKAGVKVSPLASRADTATLLQNIRQTGALLGNPDGARELEGRVTGRIDALSLGSKQLDAAPRLLYLMIHPGRPPMVAGGNTAASTLITLAGGQNPAANLSNYQILNLESLLAMKPDGILVSQRSLKQDPQLLAHALPQIAQHPDLLKRPVYAVSGQALIGGLNLSTLAEAERLQQQLLSGGQKEP